jgi:hypothetical protein
MRIDARGIIVEWKQSWDRFWGEYGLANLDSMAMAAGTQRRLSVTVCT